MGVVDAIGALHALRNMGTLFDIPSELAELAAIEAESIGWLHLGEAAYLHVGKPEEGAPEGDNIVIHVVGLPDAGMVDMNVLWLGL